MKTKECVFTKFEDLGSDEKKGELRACYRAMPEEEFQEFWEKWLDGLECERLRKAKRKADRVRRCDALMNPGMRHHKFIRVSLPDMIDRVKEQMWRLSNLNYLRDDMAFVLEYHSHNFPDGGNLHMHLITHTKTKDSKIRTDLMRVFKVANSFIETCDYRPDLYDTRCGYIRGDKAQHKDEFCAKDKLWRHDNELKDYYNFGFFQ